MAVKVIVYDADTGDTDGDIYLELDVIPRAGELLNIHHSLIPACVYEDEPQAGLFEFIKQEEIHQEQESVFKGMIEYVVSSVRHYVDKEGKQTIELICGIADYQFDYNTP